MQAYIDKSSLVSFVRSSSKNTDKFNDCTRMLKSHFDIKMNFSKESLKEHTEENIDIKTWLVSLTQGFKGNIDFDCSFPPERPLKSNVTNDWSIEQLSSVYCLDDEKVQSLQDYGAIMFIPVGQELEKLSSLLFADYQFIKTQEIKKMVNWDEFSEYQTPCTDIIIVDQYILSDESIYETNIYTLILKLSKFIRNQKINITIFTLKTSHNRDSNYDFVPNWDYIKRNIKSRVKRQSNVDPNVTFVLASHQAFAEHDRTIFTNYRYIYSGDTFNYFNSSWKVISKGRLLTISSLANKEIYNNAMDFINDMQVFINKVLSLNNSDLILGDKKSKYLKFT